MNIHSGRRTARLEAVDERIREAAIWVSSRQGFRKARTEQIAREAG